MLECVDGRGITGRRTLRADVCVVGSGAGGAVVAAELAEGGLDVVVLEEGAWRSPADATARPRDMVARLYRDGGQIVTLGRPPLMLPLGSGTGGTTFVNSGTCFRTPPRVLARWEREHGIEPLADEVFDRVEEALGVAEVPAALAGRNAAVIRRGAERLGWSGGYLHRNARGCQGSGVCAFGCPTGAKQHAGEVYLPRALEAGATIVTGARADRVTTAHGGREGGRGAARPRATGVAATTAGGGALAVLAPTVVVAAGAVHTPLLLARSALGGPAKPGRSGLGGPAMLGRGGLGGPASGQLGRNLTVHPATAVWGVFDEEVDMSRGVPQSYYVDEFADEGFVFEGIAGPPDYLAMAVPFMGDRHRELMLAHRHVAQCGMMVSDTSRGRVTSLFGRPVIRYDLDRHDTHTFRRGLERLAELFFAAGARSVVLPVAGRHELHAGETPSLDGLRPSDLKLMAFHPLGTARAHADPGRGVTDEHLKLHGADGVHVADGSAVPGPLGVNPQITIMALASRLAGRLLEKSTTEVQHACRS